MHTVPDRGGDFDPGTLAHLGGTRARSADKGVRQAAILDLLAEHGRLEVAQAALLLSVSEATARRDFAALCAMQLATRRHGGIVATAVAYELPGRYRASIHDDRKQRIAQLAATLVSPGQVVGCNGGTTTTAVVRELAAREGISAPPEVELTVVTNALNIAAELVLRPQVRCVSLGGVARPISYEAVGALAEHSLRQLWLDVAIIGVDGVSALIGASCRHDAEAAVSSLMCERASRVIVVTTGEKVGQRSFATICPPAKVRTLVTDPSAPPAALEGLREEGIEVILA